MSLLTTVFKIPTRAQLGFLKLDCSMRETHSRTATVTKNAVEDGVDIADHVNLAPRTFSIDEGIVSDVPVSLLGLGVSGDDILGATKDFAEGNKGAFTDLKDSFTSQFKSSKNASLEEMVKKPSRSPDDAWKYLNELMESRIPFSAVTALQRYENVVITSLSAPRTASNGKSLHFSAKLEQITIVKSATTRIPAFKVKGDAANSAQSKSDLGGQAGKNATDAQTDDSSLLLKGFKKVGIF